MIEFGNSQAGKLLDSLLSQSSVDVKYKNSQVRRYMQYMDLISTIERGVVVHSISTISAIHLLDCVRHKLHSESSSLDYTESSLFHSVVLGHIRRLSNQLAAYRKLEKVVYCQSKFAQLVNAGRILAVKNKTSKTTIYTMDGIFVGTRSSGNTRVASALPNFSIIKHLLCKK